MFVIYSKKGCSFCTKAVSLLVKHGLPYVVHDVTNDVSRREELLRDTAEFNHRTFPFVYTTEGRFVGGYTDLLAMVENGIGLETDNDF